MLDRLERDISNCSYRQSFLSVTRSHLSSASQFFQAKNPSKTSAAAREFSWSLATHRNSDKLNGDKLIVDRQRHVETATAWMVTTAVITPTDWVKTVKKQQVKMETRVYTFTGRKIWFRNYYDAHPIFQTHHTHWWFPLNEYPASSV